MSKRYLHTEKVGIYVPERLHQEMMQAAKARLTDGRPTYGALRLTYEDAFAQLLSALDAGEDVVFAVRRSPKDCRSLRLSSSLCADVRERMKQLNVKLTDFACTAVDRYLAKQEGTQRVAYQQDQSGAAEVRR
ncbi:hypothetical protein LJR225_005202 [Phenylobacterium sp. LjRoot225]|uniref:hypothetical protein n=1 Tax=Phenylobacterium sp. LjRoot225 TaxID=3342285 RepID=UPI003ECE0735